MDLSTPLSELPGIGPRVTYRLKKMGLATVYDLVFHFPFRYEDFSKNSTISEAKIGEKVTLKGEVWSIKNIYTRSRKVLTQAIFNDGTTPIELVWFNQRWLLAQIKTGDKLQISGKITKYKNKFSIIAPVWERLTQEDAKQQQSPLTLTTLHTGRLVPVYPETLGLSSKWLRNKVSQLLPEAMPLIEDPLPETLKSMVPLSTALHQIHLPDSWESLQKARERLAFDELFFMQLATQKVRREWKQKPLVKPLKPFKKAVEQFINFLPFQLTNAQQRVTKEVIADLTSATAMNRLIQGEVGSGKTVVAAIASYLVFLNGLRVTLMAPTEILAFQHCETLSKLLLPHGVQVGIYTGSRKYTKSRGNPHIVVGTHALLSEKLETDNIGLVVIDEQQRFGVEQRSFLRDKAKLPHFLTMTATPIPRTVALTIYGDLDISIIDELPKNRQKIKTFVVPGRKRKDAEAFIAKKVSAGDQVYIITPLIELSETLTSAKAATKEFERLQKEAFSTLRLGLLHGRMKSQEKDKVMKKFRDHEIDILVSTSVVEVGVDVPNATIMVVESAERFGLAQLHQLRGRVGRGNKESFCLLFPEDQNSQVLSRLKFLEQIDQGLRLAEIDLKIRGAGEIYGARQSGRPEFKVASLSDLPLIDKARQAALQILQDDLSLDKYPALKAKLRSQTGLVAPD